VGPRRFAVISRVESLALPEGVFNLRVSIFEESDRQILYAMYKNWRVLCADIEKLGGRGTNLPEVLSEGAFCLEIGAVRILSGVGGADTSFDCYDLKKSERIQVKACSIIPDLTSFGPRSSWDRLYFLDFWRTGKWDGTFDIYLIDNNDIYNQKVNQRQTFRDQQAEGRRPRFSIYSSIIQPKGLAPLKTGRLTP